MNQFGKYARPTSPHLLNDRGVKITGQVVPSQESKQRSRLKAQQIVEANNCFGMGGSTSGGGGSGFGPNSSASSGGASPGGQTGQGFNLDRYNPTFDRLEEGTVLEDWIPRDGAGMDLMFRRMHLRDHIFGPGIDIIKNLPWSDFTLTGIDDPAILQVYQDQMDAFSPLEFLPDLTGDMLVVGRDISSLLFNERRGIFSAIVPIDADFVRMTPMPIYGQDPLLDFKLSPGFKNFLNSDDPRMVDARKMLPPAFLEAARNQNQFLPLDPLSTLFVARRTSKTDWLGTSLLTRGLYFWAIEKALLNAQLVSTRKRAKSFLHIKAGTDLWQPTPEQMDALAGLAMQMNEDPTGGVMVTRTGVEINEPAGGGADFYKWSDELELFSKYKMNSIGISDALFSGDSNYSSGEQARSVFVETLAVMRARITHKIFYRQVFPTIARVNGFIKRSPAELQHRIRTSKQSMMPTWASTTQVTANRLTQRRIMETPTSDLIMPGIEFSKKLKADQDDDALATLERLQQNDIPTTLQQWAQAAGFQGAKDPDRMVDDIMRDKERMALIKRAEQDAESPTVQDSEGYDRATDAELGIPEETGASIYSMVKRLDRVKPKNLNELGVWDRRRTCAGVPLMKIEKVASSLLRDYLPAILKDLGAVRTVVAKKVGSENVDATLYALHRIGLIPASRPSAEAAAKIMASAMDGLKRYSEFSTATSILQLKRTEREMGVLSGLLSSPEQAQAMRKQVRDTLAASVGQSGLGKNQFGGI